MATRQVKDNDPKENSAKQQMRRDNDSKKPTGNRKEMDTDLDTDTEEDEKSENRSGNQEGNQGGNRSTNQGRTR